MKFTINILVYIFGLLLLASVANAESPREQLKQMVEQLRQSPNDNVLREKIIKFAPTLKPSPVLPDAAITFEGRAQFAFGSAKSEEDFLAAAQEYEKAVAAAPWVSGYYADLCTIYEKSGKFEDAKRHCGFYLIGLNDPVQVTDVKRRIAGLEFGIEKANSTATSQQAAAERRRFVGNWYRIVQGGSGPIRQSFTIVIDPNGGLRLSGSMPARTSDIRLEGAEFKFRDQAEYPSPDEGPVEYAGSLSADGSRLRFTFRDLPYTPAQEKVRLRVAGGGSLRPPNNRFGHEEWLKE